MIPRYSRPEMAALWRTRRGCAAGATSSWPRWPAWCADGIAPQEALEACRARAGDFTAADVARIDEIEKTTKHDVIAFLTFMEERIGPEARWLHWGMTSTDVLDTSLAPACCATRRRCCWPGSTGP